MLNKPAPIRPRLAELLEKSKEAVAKMTPEQREEMLRQQAESWARANVSTGDPSWD